MISAAFEGYPRWASAVLALATVFVIAYLVAELVSRLAWQVFKPLLGPRAAGFAATTLLRPVRLIRVVVFLLVWGTLILPAMELAGLPTYVGLDARRLVAWLVTSGLRIGLILLLGYTIVRIASLIISRLEQDVTAAGGADFVEQAKRIRTLGDLIRSTLGGLVTGIAALMILRELHLDITPILTGAGIAGLAVGFGAQTLVKDVISGFFLLLENQVRVGDVASINGTGGLVEAITLRTIVLRDETGTVYIFPNGSITSLANQSKDFSFYVINLSVSYDEDLDRVIDLLRSVGDGLREEERFKANILAPVEVIGVDNFTDASVIVKARIKTLPLKQWDVGREWRRRLKKRFDEEGIAFPTRQVVVNLHEPHTRESLAALQAEAARLAGRSATETATGAATPAAATMPATTDASGQRSDIADTDRGGPPKTPPRS